QRFKGNVNSSRAYAREEFTLQHRFRIQHAQPASQSLTDASNPHPDRPPALPAANRGYRRLGPRPGTFRRPVVPAPPRRSGAPCGANPRYLGGIKPADADGGDRHGGAGTFIEVEAIAAKIALATRPLATRPP